MLQGHKESATNGDILSVNPYLIESGKQLVVIALITLFSLGKVEKPSTSSESCENPNKSSGCIITTIIIFVQGGPGSPRSLVGGRCKIGRLPYTCPRPNAPDQLSGDLRDSGPVFPKYTKWITKENMCPRSCLGVRDDPVSCP